MKAVVMREPGSPDVLRYEEAGRPEPGDGEVLISLTASGGYAEFTTATIVKQPASISHEHG